MIKKISAPRMGAILAVTLLFSLQSRRVAGDGMFRIPGHVPSDRIHAAEFLGPSDASERMSLAVVLKARDQAGLDDFLRRLQDPADPAFHKYLSTAEFADRFGPAAADVEELTAHLARYGLSVKKVHESRLVVDVDGPVSAVEDAFQLQVGDYRLADGRVARAANADPVFPAGLAGKINTVAGLSGFTQRQPHVAGMRELPRDGAAGVGDFMTPAKIKSAYSLSTVAQTGAGETLALFELDGYNAADITAYATNFSLPAPTMQNVLVDNVTGAAGAGAIEVTLDIELAAAVAPGLAKIMVYEGPNTDQGVLDTYSKIASDNLAKEVSSSWGAPEDMSTAAFLNGENAIFQQMAAQGQSIFAAAGDAGAYDDIRHRPTTLLVDDPASQPYVTGVGGTTLTLTTANTYQSEAAWGDTTTTPNSGGGGGVSKIWPIPSWQAAIASGVTGGSATQRMVPDVSLDANPDTGYPIYFTQSGQSSGGWILAGGTSCAAPMWAAFMALVNQSRVASGQARIGFANPSLYQVGESAQYPVAFHDVGDGSKNLFYATTLDYDLATGWGSFNGAGLYTNLTGASLPPALAAPTAPDSFSAVKGN